MLVGWWVYLPLADLPVHCLQQQIVGDWLFSVGEPHSTLQLCGHHTPGEVADIEVMTHSAAFGERLRVRLDEPDLATLIDADGREGAVGWWTMIYDQGFEVRLSGRSYFAFSSVVRAPALQAAASTVVSTSTLASSSTLQVASMAAGAGGATAMTRYASRCARTAVGWYHEPLAMPNETHTDAWGCYTAVRIGGSSRNETTIAERRRRLHGGWKHGGAASSSAAGQAPVRAANDERPDQIKYAGLPTAWDWRNVNGVNYVPPARTQGSCGACYVIATVGMLESRLAIASGGRERPTLSVQEILSCSAYSQGCLGGFPYLVGKYLTDVGVVSEQCFPTTDAATALFHPTPTDVDGPPAVHLPACSERCPSPSRRWYASDYRYVGGRYGGCSEAEMMHEIYKHGPVVAGFEASAALYTHGGDKIYSSAVAAAVTTAPTSSEETAGTAAKAATMTMVEEALPFDLLGGDRSGSGGGSGGGRDGDGVGDRDASGGGTHHGGKSFFERTNHAVLVVGWGVEAGSGRKYWWAQNTWGSEWGLGGYFKMARGTDDSAFESMAVAIDVGGAMPMLVQQPSTSDVADDPSSWDGETRRIAALRRRSSRRFPYSALAPEHAPPPSPSPAYTNLEVPREHVGPWAGGSEAAGAGAEHHSLLDSLAHWFYGGS